MELQVATREAERRLREVANANSPLLKKLPGELRNRIYELVLPQDMSIDPEGLEYDLPCMDNINHAARAHMPHEVQIPSYFAPPGGYGISLMRSCRQLRTEMISVLYGHNTFLLRLGKTALEDERDHVTQATDRWLTSWPPEAFRVLRKVIVLDSVNLKYRGQNMNEVFPGNTVMIPVSVVCNLEDLTFEVVSYGDTTYYTPQTSGWGYGHVSILPPDPWTQQVRMEAETKLKSQLNQLHRRRDLIATQAKWTMENVNAKVISRLMQSLKSNQCNYGMRFGFSKRLDLASRVMKGLRDLAEEEPVGKIE